ncbi:unnamed protein product [Gadus morhua 'NCC']
MSLILETAKHVLQRVGRREYPVYRCVYPSEVMGGDLAVQSSEDQEAWGPDHPSPWTTQLALRPSVSEEEASGDLIMK